MGFQILPQAAPKQPSLGKRFSNAVGAGLETGSQIMQEITKKNQMQEENETAKKVGIDLSGITDPKTRQQMFSLAMQGKNQKELENIKSTNKINELEQKNSINQPGYEEVKKTFGDRFANLWQASEPGAQTKLMEMGINAIQMGEDVNKLLDSAGIPQDLPFPGEKIPEKVTQLEKGKISKEFQWPDFSKRPYGYTPKTWAENKTKWRTENSPLYLENVKKLDRIDKDILATKALTKINESKKLPDDGFERLLVNPETGDFYGPAQVLGFKSPEAQVWSKIIAQFQNRAKDAFGSRVTNFDLQSYMQQFPGLLNTYEGRKRIMKMMDINYKLDQVHAKAVDEIYRHYGLDGIPMEKADELARKMISKETEKLKDEYLDLDMENQRDSGQVDSELSGKTIDVKGPDGKMYEIDESEVDQLPEGYIVQ